MRQVANICRSISRSFLKNLRISTLHTLEAPIGAEIFNDFVNNVAAGEYSHAEGYKTTASAGSSHAEGYQSYATGGTAHAEGYQTYATNGSSHSEGQGTESTGLASHAEGYYTDAKADYAHAEGQETQALNYAAHAEGYNTTAQKYAHAEGNSSIASGESSHAEGHTSHATGSISHAEGKNTYATGQTSHAENRDSHAIGESSHAEGNATRAYGKASHSSGIYTIAGKPTDGRTPTVDTNTTEGYYAHSEGNGTWAKGNSSHTEGIGTIANNEAEHASGKYNQSNSNTIFSVGIGTSDTDRKNAFEILTNGNINAMHGITTIRNLNIQDLTVDGITTLNGPVTLGDAEQDAITVNGDTTFNADVVIGKTSNQTLEVKAIPTFNEGVTMRKKLDVGKSLTVSENLKVNGNTTLGDVPNDVLAEDGTATTPADKVTINATLDAKGNVVLGSNSADVITSKGNTTIEGNIIGNKRLTISGETKLKGTLGVDSNTTIGGNLDVSGATTIGGTLGVGSNTTIGGTLGVTGKTTVSTLESTGNVDLESLDVTNNTTIGGTLGVTGKTTVSTLKSSGNVDLESLDVTNTTSLKGDLHVSGSTTMRGQSNFQAQSNFAANVLINGQLVNKGSALFESTLTVNDSAQIGLSNQDVSATKLSVLGSLLTTGNHQINGNIHVGTSRANTNLHVEGQTELNGDLYVGLKDSPDGGDLHVNGDSYISGNEIVNNRLQIGTSNSESYNYNGLLVTNGNMMLHGYQLYYAGADKYLSPTYSFNTIFNCYGNGCDINPCRIGVVGGSTNVACIDIIMEPNTISPIISIYDKLMQSGIEFDTNVNSEIYIFVYLDTYNNPYVKNEQILRISMEDVYQLFNYQYAPNWFTFKLCFAYRPSIINNRGYPEEAIDSSEYDANDFNIRIFPKSSETIEHDDLVFATIDITDNGADYFNWINGNIYEFNCLNGSIIGTKIY